MPCPAQITHMDVKQGTYSPVLGASFELRDFDADMVARGKGSPLCFVREAKIAHGGVFVSAESLTKLFQQKTRQGSTDVSDVKVETRDDQTAHISGKLHKKMDVSFEIEGPVTTDGTNLILQAKKIKADKFPVKALLGMMGKNLGTMLRSESVAGVEAREDTLIFKPALISHAEGHIAKLVLSSQGMEVTYTPEEKKTVAATRKKELRSSPTSPKK